MKIEVTMLKQLIKHSFRAFRRQRGYFAINIFGLAVGIACSILITLFVLHEVSYDNYHANKNRIHQLVLHGKIGGQEMEVSSTASIIGPTMAEEFPGVDSFLRINNRSGVVLKKNSQSFIEDYFIEADSSFFEFFSIPLLRGDPKSVLSSPRQLVISEKVAKKIFGDDDPINKSLKVGTDSTFYTVSGVFGQVPENTHFRVEVISSFMTNPRSRSEQWLANSFSTYVMLNPNTDPADVDAAIPAMLAKYVGPELESYMGVSLEEFFEQGNRYNLYLLPITDIHLNPDIQQQFARVSDPKYLYIFGSIAILIILIACINYMNLSTAQAARRAREVGLKKVVGSSKAMLVKQFIAESIILTSIALFLALIIVHLVLPFFANLLGLEMRLNYLENWYIIPGLLILAVIVGFLSGSYPAFFLSSFKPIVVLKGGLSNNMKNGRLRSILVVFQFGISIALIIGTTVMFKQINFLLNKDLGFNKEQLLVVQSAGTLGAQIEGFKEDVKKIPGVAIVSASTAVPSYNNNTNGYRMDGKDDAFLMETNWVDLDYFETYELAIGQGRFFEEEFTTDQQACIINESAVREYDLKTPLNERFMEGDPRGEEISFMPIVGVVKDFHFNSLHNPIQPHIMRFKDEGMNFGFVSIRLLPTSNSNTIAQVEEVWKRMTDNNPLQYFFMDEDLNRLYKGEKQNATLAIIFSMLAIIIAALGLFGLTTYTLQQRTREIGIRKTMGARISDIFILVSKEIFILIGIATLIAWPLVFYFMRNWLENFHYRIKLAPLEFIMGFAIAILIAILTISYRTIKTARTNPADSLQYE